MISYCKAHLFTYISADLSACESLRSPSVLLPFLFCIRFGSVISRKKVSRQFARMRKTKLSPDVKDPQGPPGGKNKTEEDKIVAPTIGPKLSHEKYAPQPSDLSFLKKYAPPAIGPKLFLKKYAPQPLDLSFFSRNTRPRLQEQPFPG